MEYVIEYFVRAIIFMICIGVISYLVLIIGEATMHLVKNSTSNNKGYVERRKGYSHE